MTRTKVTVIANKNNNMNSDVMLERIGICPILDRISGFSCLHVKYVSKNAKFIRIISTTTDELHFILYFSILPPWLFNHILFSSSLIHIN